MGVLSWRVVAAGRRHLVSCRQQEAGLVLAVVLDFRHDGLEPVYLSGGGTGDRCDAGELFLTDASGCQCGRGGRFVRDGGQPVVQEHTALGDGRRERHRRVDCRQVVGNGGVPQRHEAEVHVHDHILLGEEVERERVLVVRR